MEIKLEVVMKDILKYWKKNLGMMDWDLYLKSECNGEEMEGCLGLSWHSTVYKYGKIKIAERRTFLNAVQSKAKDESIDRKMEQTVVHELLHIKFSIIHDDVEDGMSKSSAIYSVLHQNIEDLSVALVSQRYNIEISELKHGYKFEKDFIRV